MICPCCKLLESEQWTDGLCSVCFFECPDGSGVDLNLDIELVRFQRYFIAGIKLSNHALTERLIEDDLCPRINRTPESRARAIRLREEDVTSTRSWMW